MGRLCEGRIPSASSFGFERICGRRRAIVGVQDQRLPPQVLTPCGFLHQFRRKLSRLPFVHFPRHQLATPEVQDCVEVKEPPDHRGP